MISLDDEQALRAGDPSGQLDAFATLPAQLTEGYGLGAAVDLPDWDRPDAVVLCGMGGSAAAADAAVSGFFAPMVPIMVVRAEELPHFVNERTLVIGISYSGETEETLRAVDDAQGRGARLVTVASGGRLGKIREVPTVLVPGTAPSPRAALGWLTGAVRAVLDRSSVSLAESDQTRSRILIRAEGENDGLGQDADTLARVLASLGSKTPVQGNEAKQLAAWVGNRVPVIWSAHPRGEAAAWRWKTGFNENAKIPAFSGSLPELMHHEIVGWTKGWGEHFAVIVLRLNEEGDGSEEAQNRSASRVEAMLTELDGQGIDHREVRLPGTGLAEHLGLMAVGNFASTYHALMRGVDPTPIEAIARIKDRLR